MSNQRSEPIASLQAHPERWDKIGKRIMGMGGPGDHPLTDMLVWNLHPFPPDIEAMLREVLEIDPGFPDGKRKYIEQVEWSRRFYDWEKGQNLDEGREALTLVLSELKNTEEK